MGLRNRSKRLVALPKVTICASLCSLCVLCVSVVDEFRAKTHHRDTENTEVAQRILRTRTYSAKPLPTHKEQYEPTTKWPRPHCCFTDRECLRVAISGGHKS